MLLAEKEAVAVGKGKEADGDKETADNLFVFFQIKFEVSKGLHRLGFLEFLPPDPATHQPSSESLVSPPSDINCGMA